MSDEPTVTLYIGWDRCEDNDERDWYYSVPLRMVSEAFDCLREGRPYFEFVEYDAGAGEYNRHFVRMELIREVWFGCNSVGVPDLDGDKGE